MSSRSWEPVLVTALLGCILVLGVALRLQDPLSSRALGAEDPYTHVVFTKEWIDQGYFADSFHLGTAMYPPGMHAWLAAFVPFTGISLYEFARVGPAFIAAIGLVGLYVLGARVSGRAAGLGAAFLAAIMPEHIFRTELLFPTAFDLALLPLWLLGYHIAITTHRRAGSILFLGASLPLAMMHPWAIPLFGAPLAIYAAIRFVRAKIDRPTLLLATMLIVPPTAFAVAFRWEESDTGFSDFLGHVPGLGWLPEASIWPPILFVGLMVGLFAAGLAAATLLTFIPRIPSRAARIGISISLCVAVLAMLPVMTRDPPLNVSFRVMFGPIVLLVGVVGLALAFLRPTALGDMGIALAVVLFPLVAIDIFHSPFWPQRTAVYLGVAAVILGATVFGHAHALALAPARTPRVRRLAAPAALVALGLIAAGTAAALPVNTYEWYRLYNDEQFEGFQEVAHILERDEGSRTVIYTWQPALIVKTLTEPEHVWYSPKFFSSAEKRVDVLGKVQGPAYVLVDRFTTRAADQGKTDISFLEEPQYDLVYQTSDGVLRLYEVRE